MNRVALYLSPRSPYSFELTAGSAAFFRKRYGADIYEDGTFLRPLDTAQGLCLTQVRSVGTTDSPKLEVTVIGKHLSNSSLEQVAKKLSWILGVDQELWPFYHSALNHRMLKPFIEGLWGMHIPHTASVYEALIQAILGQQINSSVAGMLRRLLIENYGPVIKVDGAPYYGFPRPETLAGIDLSALRNIKLSTRKAEYIIDISRDVASGKLNLERLRTESAPEAIRALTALRGVGLWTTHWLMIRSLGHSDGFPHADLALCRMMEQLTGNAENLSPEKALKYSERWSPFRSYVTAYLFAALRSGHFAELIGQKRSEARLRSPLRRKSGRRRTRGEV
jgi:DNA-3-methyladenine glycosylase II